MEEELDRVRGSIDRLKEEKEETHKQKKRLKRMAEMEMERLKEELPQQKERDNRL